ncbi:hypothetical protein [Actinacidiphila glaucinigra]|uniref:hypothetical protein n=1 Tax=Actinacidiphila glaucinigra TaxID=235986 RepID=UPI002E357735|nr:hypothetical protein [Actinacidiphila glaucinigra]
MADLATPAGVPASSLPPDVRDLIEAVVEALSIPRPAVTERDMDAHDQLLNSRASDVCIQLASLLRAPNLNTPAETARHLRAWIADTPVTYTPRNGGQR